MTFTIEELVIPAKLDGSAAARDFEQSVEARNAAVEFVAGTDEMAYPATELLPDWQPSTHEPRRLLGARVDGRIVARGCYETRSEGDAANTEWLQVQVHPDFTGRGIGRALSDGVEAMASAGGKQQIHVYAGSSPAPGPRLEPPTGLDEEEGLWMPKRTGTCSTSTRPSGSCCSPTRAPGRRICRRAGRVGRRGPPLLR